MQKSTRITKITSSRKSIDYKNTMLLTFILLPLISFTFYSSPMVLGQDKEQNNTSKDILICQISEYIESPIGSNMHQVSNICSYQNSIGYNQSLSELCFIYSGKSIDIVNAFCNKAISNQVTTPAVVNDTSATTPAVVNRTNDTLKAR